MRERRQKLEDEGENRESKKVGGREEKKKSGGVINDCLRNLAYK
jgi:hypothetical protein